MKITIGHLFYDLLNLYGENGNIKALQNAFKQQNIEVEIKEFSLNNKPWDLSNIDVFYIGAGTEANQKLALNSLMEYKDIINDMIKDNVFFIATGNSIELFGSTIKDDETVTNGLNLFSFSTQRTKNRIVSECVFNYDELSNKILGFENHQGVINGISEPLFTIEKGVGSNTNSKTEGFKQNNFYGTYLLGPLLVRNPELLEKICKEIILNKDSSFEFNDFDFNLEYAAHNKFLEKYNKD